MLFGGQDEHRSLSGPQKRLPDERCEPVGFDPGAAELLARHLFQQPGAIRADLGMVCLDQPLELTARGKLV